MQIEQNIEKKHRIKQNLNFPRDNYKKNIIENRKTENTEFFK